MLVKLSPLHFSYNTAFQGTSCRDFETHITSISSCHPRNFDTTTHEVATEEDEGSRIMRSCRIAFIPANVDRAVLEIIPNGVFSPITEVARLAYGLLPCATYCALKGSGD